MYSCEGIPDILNSVAMATQQTLIFFSGVFNVFPGEFHETQHASQS